MQLLLLLLLLTTIVLSPGGSGYFTCIQNMKFVTTEFKSGGLNEKHVVATWNLGNHLSICLQTQGNQEKPVSTEKSVRHNNPAGCRVLLCSCFLLVVRNDTRDVQMALQSCTMSWRRMEYWKETFDLSESHYYIKVGCQNICGLYPQRKNPGAQWAGGWLGPRDSLSVTEKIKHSCSCRDTNQDFSVVQPVS